MIPDARRPISAIVPMAPPLLSSFIADAEGEWQIDRVACVRGEGLPAAARLAIVDGESPREPAAAWVLRGTTSNLRYTDRRETNALTAVQEGLGRPSAVTAALIPIKKSNAWWALAQDERRAIFEKNPTTSS